MKWYRWALGSVAAALSVWAAASSVQLKDFWARPAGRALPSAAYGVIVNTGEQADTLLEATSPQAKRVELHETVRDTLGRMQMQKRERFVVPAKDSLVLRPGGLHLMLYELQQALRPGDTLQLRLRFARAGWQEVACPVGMGRRGMPSRPAEPPHRH
jgi:copper(I)-binding protein